MPFTWSDPNTPRPPPTRVYNEQVKRLGERTWLWALQERVPNAAGCHTMRSLAQGWANTAMEAYDAVRTAREQQETEDALRA